MPNKQWKGSTDPKYSEPREHGRTECAARAGFPGSACCQAKLSLLEQPADPESRCCSVASDSLRLLGLYSPWDSPGQNTGVGNLSFSRGSSQPRDWTQVSHMADGFFTSWATREAKNTGMDSLSLLQRIFLTQEPKQCLLNCRLILYQRSYQERQLGPTL